MVPLSCHGELGRRCRLGGKRMCLTGCAGDFTAQKWEMDGGWRRGEKLVRSWSWREFGWAACVEDVSL